MKQPCPFCGEEIHPDASKCKHCGEMLVDDEPAAGGSNAKLLIIILVCVLVVPVFCLIPIIAAIAIPNLIEARKNGNETAAIGALKTISTAQSLFREADKESDGNLDYGTLAELAGNSGPYGLIDSVLGSGTKNGYLFECTYHPQTSEFLWMATARPVIPGTTGDRYFATNQQGVIFYSAQAPIPITPDCSIPQGIQPVGR